MSGFGQLEQGVRVQSNNINISTNTQEEKAIFCNATYDTPDGKNTLKKYEIMVSSSYVDYPVKELRAAEKAHYHFRAACKDTSTAATTERYYWQFVQKTLRAWNTIH